MTSLFLLKQRALHTKRLLPNIFAKLRNISVENFVTGKPKSYAAILSFTSNLSQSEEQKAPLSQNWACLSRNKFLTRQLDCSEEVSHTRFCHSQGKRHQTFHYPNLPLSRFHKCPTFLSTRRFPTSVKFLFRCSGEQVLEAVVVTNRPKKDPRGIPHRYLRLSGFQDLHWPCP